MRNSKIVTYERNNMLSTARQAKYRKIKQVPKMLNFWVSEPGLVGSGIRDWTLLPPAMMLQQGNVLHMSVILFTGGGLCPSMYHRSHD